MKIGRWNARLGEPTEENMRRCLESEGHSVVRYDYSPGTCFPNHAHAFDKTDAVVTGQLRVETEAHEFLLGPGDMLEIPAGVVHNAKVIGDGAVVSLDASKRQEIK